MHGVTSAEGSYPCGASPAEVAEDSFAQVGQGVACGVLGRALCCGGKYRPAVEYSGYTWNHLPVPDGFLCRKTDAIPAIFAARMARSSLLSRSFCK